VLRGFRTGDLFWDVYYATKFALLPSTTNRGACHYYARDRWPQYDFHNKPISRTKYQVVRKPRIADSEPGTIAVVR